MNYLLAILTVLLIFTTPSFSQTIDIYCNTTILEKQKQFTSEYWNIIEQFQLNPDSIFSDISQRKRLIDSLKSPEIINKIKEIENIESKIDYGGFGQTLLSETLLRMMILLGETPEKSDIIHYQQYYQNSRYFDFGRVYGRTGASKIIEANGKVWFKSGAIFPYTQIIGHLFNYDNEKINLFYNEEIVDELNIDILFQQNMLWVKHRFGFSWHNGQEWKKYVNKNIDLDFSSTYVTNNGTVFIFAKNNMILELNNDGVIEHELKDDFSPRIISTVETNKNLFVLSDNSLLQYQNGIWSHLNKNNGLKCKKIFDITSNGNGNLLAGTQCGLFLLKDNDEWIKLPMVDGKIFQLFKESNNRIWVFNSRSKKNGVILDGYKTKNFTLPSSGGVDPYLILTARPPYEDKNGRVWFRSSKDVLAHYSHDLFSKNFANDIGYNRKFSIISLEATGDISAFFEDTYGNIWAEVDSKVFYYNSGNWIDASVPLSSEINEKVFLVKDNLGVVWFVAKEVNDGGGVEWVFRKRENDNWKELFTIDGKDLITDNRLQVIYQDSNGNIWFGFINGIVKFHN